MASGLLEDEESKSQILGLFKFFFNRIANVKKQTAVPES